jgi:hypothetical protein
MTLEVVARYHEALGERDFDGARMLLRDDLRFTGPFSRSRTPMRMSLRSGSFGASSSRSRSGTCPRAGTRSSRCTTW